MAVPEAAIHEDRSAILWQDDIRLSGQVLAVEPESITPRVEPLADNHFGPGILAPDTRHHLGAFGF